MAKSTDTRPVYYVYVLFDWMGVPRYVGKGQGNRINGHERSSDQVNFLKNEFIEQTWIMLGEIPKIKIGEQLTELEAFELEINLVKTIGRMDKGKGPLTNRTDGGPGIPSLKNPPKPLVGEKLAARNAAIKRAHMTNWTAEERSERSRERQRLLGSERRKASTAKRLKTMTKEQLSAMAVNGGLASGRQSWINNGITNKRIPPEQELPSGWNRGRLWELPVIMLTVCQNTKWINNGIKSKRLKADKPIPEGWKFGRKPKVVHAEKLCACGCGEFVKRNSSTYTRGHYSRKDNRER